MPVIPLDAKGVNLKPPPGAAFMTIGLCDAAGRPLPHLVAKEGPVRRLVGLGMIAKDLDTTKNLLSAAIADEPNNLTELRWHGAVVAYARAFVSADGRGFRLEASHVAKLGSPHAKTHKRMLELRHEYIAHAGKNEEQRCIVIIPIVGGMTAPAIDIPFVADITATSLGAEEMTRFLDLATALRELVEGAVSNLKCNTRRFQ